MGTLSGTGGYPWPPRSGSGGGGSIDFTKVNRDATKEGRFEKSTDFNIPAGWAHLNIYNGGLNDIVVNGKAIHPGGNWNGREFVDWAAKKLELGPAIVIIANGEFYAFEVIYPTSSSVDVTTF